MQRPARGGFTLTELMVVLVVIATIVSIALPNLIAARVAANESAAVASLRTVTNAQTQYQTAARADVDNDGMGEYGTLAELGGARAARVTAAGDPGTKIRPPILSTGFGRLNPAGEATRSGYFYRAFLPGQGGVAATEATATGDLSLTLDVDTSETTWCVYAWPQKRGISGGRTFCVNQRGQVTATDGDYELTTAIVGTNAGAGFRVGTAPDSINGEPAAGEIATDGRVWVIVQ